jgi:hypothetical protein
VKQEETQVPAPPVPTPKPVPKGNTFAVINNSNKFYGRFGKIKLLENKITLLQQKQYATDVNYYNNIENFIDNTKIFLHTSVKNLLNDFISYVKKNSVNQLHNWYVESQINVDLLIKRLITKRPIVCLNQLDVDYLDRSGNKLISKNINNVEEYINYDERMLSSFISVSVPTYFINNGKRYNKGIIDPSNNSFATKYIIKKKKAARKDNITKRGARLGTDLVGNTGSSIT